MVVYRDKDFFAFRSGNNKKGLYFRIIDRGNGSDSSVVDILGSKADNLVVIKLISLKLREHRHRQVYGTSHDFVSVFFRIDVLKFYSKKVISVNRSVDNKKR